MKKIQEFLKTAFPYWILALVVIAFGFGMSVTAHAQATTPAPIQVPAWLAPIISIVVSFVAKYPLWATVTMVIGIFRQVFKPIMSVWRIVVTATPSAADDAFLTRWEQSKAYAIVSYVFDWFASISPSKTDKA